MSKTLKRSPLSLGCDPELFIRNNDGEVIGSEKIMPDGSMNIGDFGKMVVDGVQAEINPSPSGCREILIRNIGRCLNVLNSRLGNGHADFSQAVDVRKEEYDSLSDGCKIFGCKPSFNVNGQKPIKVDPSIYMTRTGGGHIHLGSTQQSTKAVLTNPDRLIPVLDTIVGNTMVMFDRDPSNIERRLNYGRAGEYRLPQYGIEYRTLSNYWLRSPILASLTFGLARHAVDIVYSDLDTELMKLVDYDDVVLAINNNDLNLAKRNFERLEGFLVDTVRTKSTPEELANAEYGYRYPIDRNNIERFKEIVDRSEVLFPNDSKTIMNLWLTSNPASMGFYEFSHFATAK